METPKTYAESCADDAIIRRILRSSGIDYTGDRLEQDSGLLVADTPAEVAIRLAGVIGPDGLDELRLLGLEV